MASDQEKAALHARIAALETRIQATEVGATHKARSYIVKTQVFDECIPLPPPDEPSFSTGPEAGESVHVRLSRIEAQLQRIIAKLES